MLLQALVVLWELIQNQWPMFDDLEDPILDALFRLRSCNSIPVSQATDPMARSSMCQWQMSTTLIHQPTSRSSNPPTPSFLSWRKPRTRSSSSPSGKQISRAGGHGRERVSISF
jgi:hypothetical protein